MKIRRLFAGVTAMLLSLNSFALEEKSLCVWDPVGKNGPVMTFYAELKPKAISWGIDLELRAYTDEKVALNDFKAGECDGAHLSAILSRQLVPFAGTLDAMGGIVDDDGLSQIIATLANPKAGKLMKTDQYEAVASWPVGAMFAFVNDKNIDTVADLSGKKISVLNGDPQIHKLANMVGASPVGTSLATFSGQFNNGNIDIVFMPALAYNTFELYHGLGDKGGILDTRLYYGMLQTVVKNGAFPEAFGNQMRSYIASRLNEIKKIVSDAEKEIPSKYWIKVDQNTLDEFSRLSRDVRLAMKSDKTMDGKALKLMWKIRCKGNPSASECAAPE